MWLRAHSYPNLLASSATLFKNSRSETREQLILTTIGGLATTLSWELPSHSKALKGGWITTEMRPLPSFNYSLNPLGKSIQSGFNDCKHVNNNNLYNYIHGIQVNQGEFHACKIVGNWGPTSRPSSGGLQRWPLVYPPTSPRGSSPIPLFHPSPIGRKRCKRFPRTPCA